MLLKLGTAFAVVKMIPRNINNFIPVNSGFTSKIAMRK